MSIKFESWCVIIVRYPTGFYRLPVNPGDGGNVTFLISNNPPPRANLLFQKVPAGIVLRKRQPVTTSIVSRRSQLGSLIFSVSSASRTAAGNNSRQFEIGQVIEFETQIGSTIEAIPVADATEIRHDTNRFDYASLGLTDVEQQLLADSTLQTQSALTVQLNQVRQLYADSIQNIATYQKTINDLNRNIEALLVVVQTVPTVQELIDKFVARRTQTQGELDHTKELVNKYANESVSILDQLRIVATVVK